jgi:hypothetical protein
MIVNLDNTNYYRSKLKNRKNFKDLTGKKFGRLTVIEFYGNWCGSKPKITQRAWLCKCECGNFIIRTTALLNGKAAKNCVQSCGCYNLERISKLRAKPGVGGFNTYYAGYKGGAKHRNLVFELTKVEFYKLTQQNCHYCGRAPFRIIPSNYKIKGPIKNLGDFIGNGVDKKDSSRGYTLDNSLPCCYDCNFSKNDSSYEDFINRIISIYKNITQI